MSIIKHPEQRVGVFIDTQNVYHSAKNIYHARANFGNILKDCVAGRRLIRARAYSVTTESGEEKGFFGREPKNIWPLFLGIPPLYTKGWVHREGGQFF